MKKGNKNARKKHQPSFRSKLEEEIARALDKEEVEYEFEPPWGKLEYTIPAKKSLYTPDFYMKTRSGKTIIVEGKGIWVYEDRFKHLLLRKSRPDLDIRFVFSNSKNKIRKGSKTTYADICEGKGKGLFKGVTWKYADKKVPEHWINE